MPRWLVGLLLFGGATALNLWLDRIDPPTRILVVTWTVCYGGVAAYLGYSYRLRFAAAWRAFFESSSADVQGKERRGVGGDEIRPEKTVPSDRSHDLSPTQAAVDRRVLVQSWRQMIQEIMQRVNYGDDPLWLLEQDARYLALEPQLTSAERRHLGGRTVVVGTTLPPPLYGVKLAVARLEREWGLVLPAEDKRD